MDLYYKQLLDVVGKYDKIITSFQARKLAPELYREDSLYKTTEVKSVPLISAETEAIYCTWDKPSRNQLEKTADVWINFKKGLLAELGSDAKEPRLEAASNYILHNEDALMFASTDLATSFRLMMEAKLAQISMLNKLSIIISFLIALTIFIVVYQKIFKPVDRTIFAFQRVAQGDLTHQLPVSNTLELGRLTESFNHLTGRMKALFGLTDRINQATNLDEILVFIFEEFSSFLPIDVVAMLRGDVKQEIMRVTHVHAKSKHALHEGDVIPIDNPVMQKLLGEISIISDDDIQSLVSGNEANRVFSSLHDMGMQSVIIYPLCIGSDEQALLIFASSEQGAYNTAHQELLNNITGQVSHAFDRTIGMESLVISAVEGLAKLAESRDPETGDHLTRMSLYSYILADELSKEGKYKEQISSGYVRHVYQFAPMHDIGKVGIEDKILLKPGSLSDDEWCEMKSHPVIGADVLRRCERQVNDAGYSMFKIGIEIAEGHHEKYDGTGYPHNRAAEEIPLSARIVAVADVFDALTSRRPYKEPWPVEKAIDLLHEESGKHFDPEIIHAFDRAYDRIMQVYDKHKHV